ncbi:phage tail protein [Mycolicibacter minnesotensis]|uniref:Phage tail protein n=2 Tax=Mycolicibacter minnesotensis TaxID=1118379 RepID=A0A7I7R8D3_9MYCO|nr:phage tail protein [Mycolicibacter minnesotensis]ORB04345.1 phage tail protein [Mycolicibacter minnesotensis]BBY34915.1 bacteriophage protein [Mycolicibacter minnesotensis]
MSGLATVEASDDLWNLLQDRRAERERTRLAAPTVRLWDGDYRLRGEVATWRSLAYEFIENDTGTATLRLPLSHHLAKWVLDFKGREKRNVHVTIEKHGSRWSGFMDYYKVVKTEGGDNYLEIAFLNDYEQAKHIYVWCNPFLRPELQFPKLWTIFGPAKWCCLVTLFVNILRLESSIWTLPDDPTDINEWMGLSFNAANWRNIVKPFDILSDNSNTEVVFSRFRSWHDTVQQILQDAQLTVVCRRYLKGEDRHPFSDLWKNLDPSVASTIEDLIPLRHGCLVWDIVDNSGWGTETAFGGSLLTGLVRSVVNIASDGYTEGVDIFMGDPTFPDEYYQPGFLGTSPKAPWVVFEEGPLTGIKQSEFVYHEATDTSFLTGGMSMPGVNEAISAGVNMAGDLLSSYISTQIAALPGVAAAGGAIDFPSLGGSMDAVAKLFYEDVFLAFMEIPTLRAIGTKLPLPGLEDKVTGLGDFHLFEGWADGADRAFTISAMVALRAKIYATRAHTSHTLKVADASPYIIGEPGYGHFWLGNRVGTTVLGFPDPHLVFVERVHKIRYEWDENGSNGWDITIGRREPKDLAVQVEEWFRELTGLGPTGTF